MSNFDDAIAALDSPKKLDLKPRTVCARFLAEQNFFGKEYIRWRQFATLADRLAWEQMEKDYEAKIIQSSILFFKDKCAPGVIVHNIMTAVHNYQTPKVKKATWEDMEELE